MLSIAEWKPRLELLYRGGPRRYFQYLAEQDEREDEQTYLTDSPKSNGSASSSRVNDLL